MLCNPATACPTDLSLTDVISEGTHQAATTLTANGQIAASRTVLFKAGESITLQAGFTAAMGSDFLATIDDCTSNTLTRDTPSPTTLKSSPSSDPTSNISTLKIYPNPLTHQATVEYERSQGGMSQLILTDARGSLVRTLLNETYQEAGNHQLLVEVGNLTKGLYFMLLKTTDRIITKKILIMDK